MALSRKANAKSFHHDANRSQLLSTLALSEATGMRCWRSGSRQRAFFFPYLSRRTPVAEFASRYGTTGPPRPKEISRNTNYGSLSTLIPHSEYHSYAHKGRCPVKQGADLRNRRCFRLSTRTPTRGAIDRQVADRQLRCNSLIDRLGPHPRRGRPAALTDLFEKGSNRCG
jgi:hypothetical protein